MQLGLKGWKERGMVGGALREVAAYMRKRAGQGLWWCMEPLLPPGQHGDSTGHAGKQRITEGQHPLPVP